MAVMVLIHRILVIESSLPFPREIENLSCSETVGSSLSALVIALVTVLIMEDKTSSFLPQGELLHRPTPYSESLHSA